MNLNKDISEKYLIESEFKRQKYLYANSRFKDLTLEEYSSTLTETQIDELWLKHKNIKLESYERAIMDAEICMNSFLKDEYKHYYGTDPPESLSMSKLKALIRSKWTRVKSPELPNSPTCRRCFNCFTEKLTVRSAAHNYKLYFEQCRSSGFAHILCEGCWSGYTHCNKCFFPLVRNTEETARFIYGGFLKEKKGETDCICVICKKK